MACGGLGEGFVLAVMRSDDNQSSVWGWGENLFGQLAQQKRLYTTCAEPRLVHSHNADQHTRGAGITMVAGGDRHCCVVLDDGRAFHWGDVIHDTINTRKEDADKAFQFSIPEEGGPASTVQGDTQQPVPPPHAVMAACGNRHQLVLTASGCVYSYGQYDTGALGLGYQDMVRQMPARVTAGGLARAVVVMVAAGTGHSVALDDRGGVWTWGDPARGALGHGPEAPVSYCNTRTYTHSLTTPRRLADAVLAQVVMVSAGGACSAAVHADGSLWMWGRGSCGVLGLGDTADRSTPTRLDPALFSEDAAGVGLVRTVACSGMHTLVVAQDGTLWAFGCGLMGELGGGEETCIAGSLSPLRVEFFDHADARPNTRAAVVSVAAGASRSVAVTANGRIYVWGGHEVKKRPCLVHALAHMHAGPYQGLAPLLALAFAAGTHQRLGEGSHCHVSTMPADLLRRLCEMVVSLEGPAGRSEGIKRLVGAT